MRKISAGWSWAAKTIGSFVVLASLCVNASATIILGADATASITGGPGADDVIIVSEIVPYFSFTATGTASTNVKWEIGTEDDYLLNQMTFGDSDQLTYLWKLTIDGVGTLHSDHDIIGGEVSCGQTKWEDGNLHDYSCGTESFDIADISESATVGTGWHIMQLWIEVLSSELEILATDVVTQSFTVVAVPVSEPKTVFLFSIVFAGILYSRRKISVHSTRQRGAS